MTDRFIDIPKLIPERLRDEPLLKDCIESLEHIFYKRGDNVGQQLEAIKDKRAYTIEYLLHHRTLGMLL